MNRNDLAPGTPEHLSPAMSNWFATVVEAYELEPHHLHLLRLACEAFDRATAAREAIERDGLVVTDRFGQAKAHPLAQVRKESETAFASLLRQIDLDGEPNPAFRRRVSTY